jgi:hypothetical protein
VKPLVESFANGTVEDELRQLFVRLYEETLAEKAGEINVYGAPHLGPFSLIERHVAGDGLSVIREDNEAALRYLFKAWRFRNPRRGTHFLATYLRVLFGDYEIDQLYQLKAGMYPQQLRSEKEIQQLGHSLADYFLTSRLRVQLVTSIVPERILAAMKSVVAARLILQVRIAQRTRMQVGTAQICYGQAVARMTGELQVRKRESTQAYGMTTRFAGSNLAYLIN